MNAHCGSKCKYVILFIEKKWKLFRDTYNKFCMAVTLKLYNDNCYKMQLEQRNDKRKIRCPEEQSE